MQGILSPTPLELHKVSSTCWPPSVRDHRLFCLRSQSCLVCRCTTALQATGAFVTFRFLTDRSAAADLTGRLNQTCFFLSQSYLKWSGKKPVIFQPGINKVYLSNWSLTKLQTSANEKERVGDRKHPNRQWAVAKYGNNVRNSGDISGAVGRVPVSSDKLQSLMCSLVFGCCVSGDGDKRPRERRLWLQCVWRFPGERSLCEHDPTWWTGRPSWAQTLRQDTAGDDGTLWNYKHHEEDEQQICRE